jgi:SAM-dependent methyltransferase
MTAREQELRSKVRDAYSAVAADPAGRHAFPVGRGFAESLQYPPTLLDCLPGQCVDAFTGVSNISVTAAIEPGMAVADIGCGAGLDSFVAARGAGSAGRVVGIDFSAEMLGRARSAARLLGQRNVLFCRADAECLPFAGECLDVALANGIFNLNPARDAIFRELGRIVRRGGCVYAAELILIRPLAPDVTRGAANWFA